MHLWTWFAVDEVGVLTHIFLFRSESQVEDEAAGAAVHTTAFAFQRSVWGRGGGLPAGEVVFTQSQSQTHERARDAVCSRVCMPCILLTCVRTDMCLWLKSILTTHICYAQPFTDKRLGLHEEQKKNILLFSCRLSNDIPTIKYAMCCLKFPQTAAENCLKFKDWFLSPRKRRGEICHCSVHLPLLLFGWITSSVKLFSWQYPYLTS